MNKKAFLFYLEYRAIFEPLNADDCKQLLMFMIDYVENLTEPNENLKKQMSDRLLMAWISMKQNLDRDNESYDRRRETSRENGKKGGRPKKNKNLNNLTKTYKPDIEQERDIDIVISNCSSYIEENYARAISSIEYEKIESWCKEFDEELIKYAIDISIFNGKKTFHYVQGILNNWKGLGYKTKQEVLSNEKKMEKQKDPVELFDYDWINEGE